MKDVKITPTVTIAIPAYNEEANIGHLIDDINKQQISGFLIEKIIINSDGSTDNTCEIVKKKNDPKISLIENKENLGHPAGQNKMLRMCTSDVCVILNADIEITDNHFIQELIEPILNQQVDLTSCPIVEKNPKNIFEKAVKEGMKVKNTAFELYNQGNNVYTCHGTARAFSKKLYSAIEFRDGPGEDAYSYFFCIKNGYKYQFVNNTTINYRLSDNFNDYQRQSLRFIESKKVLADEFGKDYISKQYKIPTDIIIKPLTQSVFKHPLLLFMYAIIYSVSCMSYVFCNVPKSGDLATSSKKVRQENEQ